MVAEDSVAAKPVRSSLMDIQEAVEEEEEDNGFALDSLKRGVN